MVGNRLKVGGDMRVEGRTNLWSLGDAAAVPNAYDNKPSPPTAQFALRQAKVLAMNLAEVVAGRRAQAFSFKPQGMLASIGNHKAVGLVFGIRVSGFLAWFLWRGVYLGKMPSLARKVQIAFDWAWQLFFPRDLVELSLGQTERLGRAHFEAGQTVFRRGEPGDKFYVIERGTAQVFLQDGCPAVDELKAGEHFGEGSLLHEGHRSATVKAGADGLDVLLVGRESFGKLTKHLAVLRTALERSSEGSRSAGKLLEVAQNHPHLNRLQVREVMSSPVATLPVELTFAEALARGQELHKGAYPVVDAGGRMVGLVTRTDYYRAANRMLPATTPLRDVMRSPVLTVNSSDTLTAALVHFAREPVKRLVVVADDDPAKPVGMLTPFDVLRSAGGQAGGRVVMIVAVGAMRLAPGVDASAGNEPPDLQSPHSGRKMGDVPISARMISARLPGEVMRIVLCAAVASLFLTTPARSQELTKAELAKRGKAATGFLEVGGRGTATTFCVHPSGIFVTNEHAVGSDGKRDIKIVLDAGQKTQKTYHATVIRADKNLDLALLRVEANEELLRPCRSAPTRRSASSWKSSPSAFRSERFPATTRRRKTTSPR